MSLSQRQRDIRVLIQSGHLDPKELKKERNKIMHSIRTIQKEVAMVRLDKAAVIVESAPTSAQMFLAAAQLRSGVTSRKRQPLMVEAADGHLLSQDVHKASRIRDRFITQFNHKTTPVISKPCPHTFLNPITDLEVSTAFHRMSNGKACGPDSISSELLK